MLERALLFHALVDVNISWIKFCLNCTHHTWSFCFYTARHLYRCKIFWLSHQDFVFSLSEFYLFAIWVLSFHITKSIYGDDSSIKNQTFLRSISTKKFKAPWDKMTSFGFKKPLPISQVDSAPLHSELELSEQSIKKQPCGNFISNENVPCLVAVKNTNFNGHTLKIYFFL